MEGDGKLLRQKGPICERWEPHFSTLLNASSAAIHRATIENTAQRPTAFSHGSPRSQEGTEEAQRAMVNDRAVRPDDLPVIPLTLGFVGDSLANQCLI